MGSELRGPVFCVITGDVPEADGHLKAITINSANTEKGAVKGLLGGVKSATETQVKPHCGGQAGGGEST
jgi:hypothetical protein